MTHIIFKKEPKLPMDQNAPFRGIDKSFKPPLGRDESDTYKLFSRILDMLMPAIKTLLPQK